MGFKPVNASAEIRSYVEAKEFIGPRKTRKVAHNTWVAWSRMGNSIDIRYGQSNSLIRYYRDGCCLIFSQADLGPVHIRRLNQFGPREWKFFEGGGKVYGTFRVFSTIVVEGILVDCTLPKLTGEPCPGE